MFARRALAALPFIIVLSGGIALGQDASPLPAPTSPAATAVASPGQSPSGELTEVGAIEYAFVGIPSSLSVGTSLQLRNDGQEVHELVLIRRNEGTTQTMEELSQMPQEEALALVTIEGRIWANPGETSEGSITIAQGGSYIAACFIPQGTTYLDESQADAGPEDDGTGATTPDASPGEVPSSPDAATAGASPASNAAASPAASPELGDGPPHVALGMVAEFSVGGPDASPGPAASPAADADAPSTPATGDGTGDGASPEASPVS